MARQDGVALAGDLAVKARCGPPTRKRPMLVLASPFEAVPERPQLLHSLAVCKVNFAVRTFDCLLEWPLAVIAR